MSAPISTIPMPFMKLRMKVFCFREGASLEESPEVRCTSVFWFQQLALPHRTNAKSASVQAIDAQEARDLMDLGHRSQPRGSASGDATHAGGRRTCPNHSWLTFLNQKQILPVLATRAAHPLIRPGHAGHDMPAVVDGHRVQQTPVVAHHLIQFLRRGPAAGTV